MFSGFLFLRFHFGTLSLVVKYTRFCQVKQQGYFDIKDIWGACLMTLADKLRS